jgi:sec-independent protein translocase protein TatA
MGISIWHIGLVVVLFLLLFGRGKIPQLMNDVAEGIKSFKKGIQDEPSSSANSTPSKTDAQ